MKLKPGLHLILAANDVGGAGKSTACAETRVACRLENIPCRIVTFDPHASFLNSIFRGEGVHVVTKPNGAVMLDTLSSHIEAAREAGEIIVADMPRCIADPEDPILRAFAQSQLLEEFESIGLILPVTTMQHHIKGAFDALSVYADLPVKYDRGMIRAWCPYPTSPTWESLPSWEKLKNQFPVWECPTYMESMLAMMQGCPPFEDYPSLDQLPEMFREKGSTLPLRDRGRLRAAVNHLETARQAIRTHLLEPIMVRESKPRKQPPNRQRSI